MRLGSEIPQWSSCHILFYFFYETWALPLMQTVQSSMLLLFNGNSSGLLPHFTVGQQRCGNRPSQWPASRRWRCFPALESTFAEKSAAVKPERIHAAVLGAAWESANSLWVDFWAPTAGPSRRLHQSAYINPSYSQPTGSAAPTLRDRQYLHQATKSQHPPNSQPSRNNCRKHHIPSKSPEEAHYKTKCVGRINTARTFSLVFVRSRVPHFPFFEFFKSYDGFENCCMDFFLLF